VGTVCCFCDQDEDECQADAGDGEREAQALEAEEVAEGGSDGWGEGRAGDVGRLCQCDVPARDVEASPRANR
jgi:hypothetical protein